MRKELKFKLVAVLKGFRSRQVTVFNAETRRDCISEVGWICQRGYITDPPSPYAYPLHRVKRFEVKVT